MLKECRHLLSVFYHLSVGRNQIGIGETMGWITRKAYASLVFLPGGAKINEGKKRKKMD